MAFINPLLNAEFTNHLREKARLIRLDDACDTKIVESLRVIYGDAVLTRRDRQTIITQGIAIMTDSNTTIDKNNKADVKLWKDRYRRAMEKIVENFQPANPELLSSQSKRKLKKQQEHQEAQTVILDDAEANDDDADTVDLDDDAGDLAQLMNEMRIAPESATVVALSSLLSLRSLLSMIQ